MNDFHQFGIRLRSFLDKPHKVLLVCAFVFIVSLFLNGALWRVWGLRRDRVTIQEQITAAQKQATFLDVQIKQAKDPVFIERQARDKLDLVGENDLIFVFPE
ncbi:MAG: septum formation initiator family protein [Bdellovibrionaceae bacterium]|nr:septum formation initiator family protein [Bdellovibrio sp.]